jgi:excisionase family DNA binding protein
MRVLRNVWQKLCRLLRDKRGEVPISNLFGDFHDILTIENLQKALSIGRTTAYRLISSGAIKHWKIGKVIKIPKAYLLDYIADSCYNECEVTDSPSEGGNN